MKRIIIICEGPTEREFSQKTLMPFFINKGILIQSPLIKKSNGGIVKWSELKKQIENHLKQDTSAYVTTLIDYYGLHKKYEFPGWENSLNMADKNLRMDFLEQEMANSIDPNYRRRYYPYFQLHEFEGLLFNDINVFYEQFKDEEIIGRNELEEVFQIYPNPELINGVKETAPSYRLKRIISGYKKVVFGNILAEVIGLTNIRYKCPRFNKWICDLENVP